MHRFDPQIAAESADAPNRLDDLIKLQANIDPECGQMQHQAGDGTHRDADDPQKEDICHHQELGVATSAHDTLGKDAVHALEDNDQSDGQHQFLGNGFRFGGDVVKANDQREASCCDCRDSGAQRC